MSEKRKVQAKGRGILFRKKMKKKSRKPKTCQVDKQERKFA